MAILRFPEQTGPAGNDRLTAGSQTLTFGLGGDDELIATANSEYNFLAGGAGNDKYYSAQGAAITIFDTGGNDTVSAPRLGITDWYTYAATVDNRKHLLAWSSRYGDQIAIANWLEPNNSIEYVSLGDGVFTLSEVFAAVQRSPNYRGDFSIEELSYVDVLPTGTTTSDIQEFFNYISSKESSLNTPLPTSSSPQSQESQTFSLDVIASLFGNVFLLKGLKETVSGETHTVEYNGEIFNYTDVDSFVTTVVRDGEFTSEFAQEIADAYPDVAGIKYSVAASLVGSALDEILIQVAGADGNYVG